MSEQISEQISEPMNEPIISNRFKYFSIAPLLLCAGAMSYGAYVCLISLITPDPLILLFGVFLIIGAFFCVITSMVFCCG